MPDTEPRKSFRGAQQTPRLPVLLMTFSTAPIFLNIGACNLAVVSWVIPDVKWSDHPGSKDNNGTGPDYVASLVDAIGDSPCTNTPGDGKTYLEQYRNLHRLG